MEAVFLFKPNTLLQLVLLVVMMMMREGDSFTDACLFCVSGKEEKEWWSWVLTIMMITGNVAGSGTYRCLLWGIIVVVEECNIPTADGTGRMFIGVCCRRWYSRWWWWWWLLMTRRRKKKRMLFCCCCLLLCVFTFISCLCIFSMVAVICCKQLLQWSHRERRWIVPYIEQRLLGVESNSRSRFESGCCFWRRLACGCYSHVK